MILKLYAVKQDNAGNPVSHLTLQNKLLDSIGGYTRYEGIGFWKDENCIIYRDNLLVYEIVTNNYGNIADCIRVFTLWGLGDAKQKALFYTLDNEGHTII